MKDNKIVLDHVAVATSSLERSIKVYESLGLSFGQEHEVVEEQKVKVAFSPIDETAKLELLEPTSSDSAIAKFIESKGEGIHHLCFKVHNIEEVSKDLTDKGMRLLYETPKKGAHGMLINFIHPKSTGGVLIEIAQKG